RRPLAGEPGPRGDAVGGLDDEAATLHRAGQPLAERLVIIDDQQRALALGLAGERRGGTVGIHSILFFVHSPASRRNSPDSFASSRWRRHSMPICAPPSDRLSKVS